MKVALCQENPVVGDVWGNAQKVLEVMFDHEADLWVFPELFLVGYPPQDLLFCQSLLERVAQALEWIRSKVRQGIVVVGAPRCVEGRDKPLRNSAFVFSNQCCLQVYDKWLLPTYDVFNERRYFAPGDQTAVFECVGKRVGVTICEDLWNDFQEKYGQDPVKAYADLGCDVMLNLSASPFTMRKASLRKEVMGQAATRLGCPVIFCNQVGSNDQLIFDGTSFVIGPDGVLSAQAPSFSRACCVVDLSRLTPLAVSSPLLIQQLFDALVLGLRDYVEKLGFSKVLLGLSGGIDSSVVAAIAVAALGADQVLGVMLPSKYTSVESCEDAELLGSALGICVEEISIESSRMTALSCLEAYVRGDEGVGLMEENLQSRIRGMLLMALANAKHALLLNTGNKSELAVGYTTLYGDSCGALSILGDVMKGDVYRLAAYINRDRDVIPLRVLEKPPTAELRPDQQDADSLPPYAILDALIRFYVEEMKSATQIATLLEEPLAFVDKWVRQIDQNEFKRAQMPPILKVTQKAFETGRHHPIVCRKWG